MDDTASELSGVGGVVVVAEEEKEDEKGGRGISFTEIMISILLQRLLLFYSLVIREWSRKHSAMLAHS